MDKIATINHLRTAKASYTASDIEVLEGLEPVRRRPGMYIGGTDEKALHHMVVEILDNAMDEVITGAANLISISLDEHCLTITDNGRGIPVDAHPKFPDKSALEVILTTLHSGGKFSGKSYHNAGGLHGVGLSVVNALSDYCKVIVIRDGFCWQQEYAKGYPISELIKVGNAGKRKGTEISFHPDPEIFGEAYFSPKAVYGLAKSKAYLFQGVKINWHCKLSDIDEVPANEQIVFPRGLIDYLHAHLDEEVLLAKDFFAGNTILSKIDGKLDWACAWLSHDCGGNIVSYCNTIHTPQGGTHEAGLRNALLKGIKKYGEMVGNKRVSAISAEDVLAHAHVVLSIFIPQPQFLGQTKEKLLNTDTTKLVEQTLSDYFDHWLHGNRSIADNLLGAIMETVEERLAKKNQKDINRKSITQRIKLPGKLADCTRQIPAGTEIFIVEGDSAGGSAKQARSRETQAVLPLKGKILNVASNSLDRIKANQEIADLVLALGCGSGKNYKEDDLRYEKIIIMTDADVDGAHIASLLMTYFFKEMRALIENGHLYIAKPPLYRISYKGNSYYADNDIEREKILKKFKKDSGHLEIGRFKGLGEMTPKQLKDTTMDPTKRGLIKVLLAPYDEEAEDRVSMLMGKNPECRLRFIQEKAPTYKNVLEQLDV